MSLPHLQFLCTTCRMKPFPSCALSQSLKPLRDGLGRHSAAPVPAHWFVWENLWRGFVVLNPFPSTDSAPAHPSQTQTHGNNSTSAASLGCLFPNQAQTSSKQEQMSSEPSCPWVPTCPMVCITRNMTLPPGKLPKTLLSHNLNVSIPLQAGVHHFPGAGRGAGAFPGGAGCFDFPSW